MAADDIENFIFKQEHDPQLSEIMNAFKTDDKAYLQYPQYYIGDNGLCYFEDSVGGSRLCIPEENRPYLMTKAHDDITESSHGGFAKTYNRLASSYYWPRMARDIKRFVQSCDICQKTKPRRHAPYGLLQPIPIPSRPFEVSAKPQDQ